MKIEFDSNNPVEVRAVHELARSLLGITSSTTAGATPAPAPTQAAAPSAPATASPQPAATESAASAATPAPASAATSSGNVVDFPTAASQFQAYVKQHGPAAAKAKIEPFGVKAIKDIPAERLGEFVASLAA